MDPKVIQALKVLGFKNFSELPKLKEIARNFRKLSILKHPDKNGGCKEATAEFQSILKAYQVAGDAAEKIPDDHADVDDLVARKMFKQFQISSIKENSSSVTISTEKTLNSIWMEVLSKHFGIPGKGTRKLIC